MSDVDVLIVKVETVVEVVVVTVTGLATTVVVTGQGVTMAVMKAEQSAEPCAGPGAALLATTCLHRGVSIRHLRLSGGLVGPGTKRTWRKQLSRLHAALSKILVPGMALAAVARPATRTAVQRDMISAMNESIKVSASRKNQTLIRPLNQSGRNQTGSEAEMKSASIRAQQEERISPRSIPALMIRHIPQS